MREAGDVDQPNQVKDYLKALEKYDLHLLIYLSGNGKGPSGSSFETS